MTRLFEELLDRTEPPPGKILARDPVVLNMFRGQLLGIPRAIHFGSLEGPAIRHTTQVSKAILDLILTDAHPPSGSAPDR